MELILNATEEDLKVFLEEAEEQIQLLDEDLVVLERDPENDALLQEVFRAAHTLKGSSATVGHAKMASLTHAMETVLDRLRKGQLRGGKAAFDVLLRGLDALRLLKGEVETREESGLDLTAVLEGLDRLGQDNSGAATPRHTAAEGLSLGEEDRERLQSEVVKGRHAYRVSVFLEKDSPLAGARAFQVLMELSNSGSLISSRPTQRELEEGLEGDRIEAVVASDEDADHVRNQLTGICDVQEVVVDEWIPETRGEQQRGASVGAPPDGEERRVIDLGPDARGKSTAEMLHLAAQKLSQMSRTVRIDVERLDTLMNLVGELVIDRTRLLRIGKMLARRFDDEPLVNELDETVQHVGRIADQLQEQIMKSRMIPIETVFNKFPRLVRDLSVKMHKKIDFAVEGQDTELDRSVIEEIGDPLIHLLRNAVDHGVESPAERLAAGKPETALVRLTARHEDNHILIAVTDDGKGIDGARVKRAAVDRGLISREVAEQTADKDAVRLIFQSGFSTAERVSDVSGRGVGLDIVRTNIEKINGAVAVETEVGRGTTFVIRLPLTLAIIQALLVSVADSTYAIPLAAVTETVRIAPQEVRHVNRREAIRWRGVVLPLIRLRRVYGRGDDFAPAPLSQARLFVVVVRFLDRQVGLVVDSLVAEQEIVIKPLGTLVGEIGGVSGATILGDGQVALIVDVVGLVKQVIAEQSRGYPSDVRYEVRAK